MNSKTTVRRSQGGWVVYFGNDVDNFMPFRSDEPERFVKFLCEKVAGIKIDQVILKRQEEIAEANRKMDEGQRRA